MNAATDAGDEPPAAELVAGDLRRTLYALALPVLAEQFLSFCVGFFDTYLSGRFGTEATAAIGLASYVGWLVSMLYGLASTGTMALVARHWGAGEFDEANRVLNRSLCVVAAMSLVLFAMVTSAAPWFATLLGMKGDAWSIAVHYLRRDAIGHLFTGFMLAGAAALRGAGNTRTPMFILGSVSVINVIASWSLVTGVPLPVFGLEQPLFTPWKVNGIVAGTVVARACGGLLMLACLARGVNGLRIRRAEFGLRNETVRRILRIGIPAAFDGLLMWCGQFTFLAIIGRLARGERGEAILAAHYIGMEVEAISYLPAMAWGVAAAAMTGQALGAGDIPRARRIGHFAAAMGALFAAALAVAFYFGADAIYNVMHESRAVREIGAPAFRMLAFFQVPLAVGIVYVQTLRGAGDTTSSLAITMIGIFAVRLPLGWLLGIHFDMGLIGAWTGMCADITVRGVLVFLRFASGRWLRMRV
jgi:multidrug resistance protein, MATE family